MSLRGAFPKVPAAGLANAAVLNQKLVVSEAPAENQLVTPLKGSLTWFHGCAKVSPTPATSSPRVTQSGVPVRMNVEPEICQPPSVRPASEVGLLVKNGRL